MEQKVCIDTDIAIDIIKKSPKVEQLLSKFSDFNAAISSITAFELNLRKTNITDIDNFISSVYVLPFGIETARIASGIEKALKAQGKTIGFEDVFIAATCIANGCALATLNKKHFENIKGLKIIDF